MNPSAQYEKIEKAARIRSAVIKTVIYTFLALWALMVLFPFYWMLLTSVKSYATYNSEYIPKFFTLSPTMQNYADAFTAVPLADYFFMIARISLRRSSVEGFASFSSRAFSSAAFFSSSALRAFSSK